MATFSETGHSKNVANFEQLTTYISGYGAVYNPSKTSLKLTAMVTLLTNARNVVSVVNASAPANKNAIAARELAFQPLNALATRIMNSVLAMDVSDQVQDNVKTLVRKIQGRRAEAKKTEEELKALALEGNETKNISASQMSYDSRIDSLDKLIKLLSSLPQYIPNENDLKITTITTLYNDLKTKNTNVITTTIPLSNARITRDELMYKENTGLVNIALDSKLYIKSVFGATSPQYKLISKLQFKTVKK